MFIRVSEFRHQSREKGYYAMMLMLDTGMMGVFVSMDFY